MKNQTNDPGGDHIGSCVSMVTKEVVQGWNLDLQQACNSCLHPPELDVWKIHFMEIMSRKKCFFGKSEGQTSISAAGSWL